MVACDDENVRREEGKVKEGGTKRDILTLKDLTKVYDRSSCRGKMRVAVNRLNLSMKPSVVCVHVCACLRTCMCKMVLSPDQRELPQLM